MKQDLDHIEKIIIVSNTVAEHITIGTTNIHVAKTDNVPKYIQNLVQSAHGRPLFMAIFIDINEYNQLREFLPISEYRNTYPLVSIKVDSPDDDHDSFCLDKHIGHIWHLPLTKREFSFITGSFFHRLAREYMLRCEKAESMARMLDMKQDQEDLINIGRSLSIEKDPDRLLRLILRLSKKITGADAGSIYLIEEHFGLKQIRFKYSHTFSKEIPLEEFVIPYDTNSIAGYVAVTGRVLNIPDVYKLSPDDPVSFNDSFDKHNNYRSRSMLVVPMRNHVGDIIGVIQLINSKENPHGSSSGNEAFEIKLASRDDFEKLVHPFDKRYEDLMEAVAGQAAIAIENNRMIEQIRFQFEEFVKASVMAIESRDPATSGHSFRVAEICKAMAHSINQSQDEPFRDMFFSETQIKELEYAALLHDFGKVYIDLAIFMKAKKLFPTELRNLHLKLDYLYRTTELQKIAEELTLLRKGICTPDSEEINSLETRKDEALAHILEIKQKLTTLNEPTVMEEDPKKVLQHIRADIASLPCNSIDGERMEIISDHEQVNLSIARGSLNPNERKEIESHVVHTYNFVSRIPWPPEFKNIPVIARMHHEKMDGTGYPDGKTGDEIPVQARIMAIADIYDALTATDRPYKKAMPHEKAIQILGFEAKDNHIDGNLFDLFCKTDIQGIIANWNQSRGMESA